MPATTQTAITVIGIDIGKNSFHVMGHDTRGAIVLRQGHGVLLVLAPLASLSLAGQEHGRTIPLADIRTFMRIDSSRVQDSDIGWAALREEA